jgi:hypothetical protein
MARQILDLLYLPVRYAHGCAIVLPCNMQTISGIIGVNCMYVQTNKIFFTKPSVVPTACWDWGGEVK